MWHIKSGAIQGVSGKDNYDAAFLELFDNFIQQTGHYPELGILGAASRDGFDFQPHNTTFFISEWVLFDGQRIPRMSHGYSNIPEHFTSLFEGLPSLESALELVNTREDEVLDADTIDAPNSREDVWDDEIEVPDDYFNADDGAPASGS